MAVVGGIIKHYLLKEKLGSGSSGRVFVAFDNNLKKNFAMKVIDLKAEKEQKAMEAEIKVGLTISRLSPFLVKYEDVMVVGDECCLVMEYFEQGDLSQMIKKRVEKKLYFTDEELVCSLYQICAGLKVLHDGNIVHRDLKPQNIFVGENKVTKIGDFSISRSVSGAGAASTVAAGTMGYSCLEILNGASKPTKEMDLFALGCIFLEMIDLSHPFSNEIGAVVLGNIFSGKINAPAQAHMSASTSSLREVGLALMSKNPSSRPEINTVLGHPVFQTFLAQSFARAVSSGALQGDGNIPVRITAAPEQTQTQAKMQTQTPKQTQVQAKVQAPTPKQTQAQAQEHAQAEAQSIMYPVVFLPKNPLIGITYEGAKVIFRHVCTSVSLEADLSRQRIFILDIAVSGFVAVGLVLRSLFPSHDAQESWNHSGVCALGWCFLSVGKKTAFSDYHNTFWEAAHDPATGVLFTPLRLEFNQITHTLHFFVKGQQISHMVKSVPADVYFTIITRNDYGAAEVLSLQSAEQPTVSPSVACKQYVWR